MRAVLRHLAPPLVVSAFYFTLLIYPALRIWYLLLPDPGTLTLTVIIIGPIVARLVGEWLPRQVPGALRRGLAALALTWLGVYFISFPLVFSFELVRLVLPLSDQTWGFTLLAGAAAVSLYAASNAQRLVLKYLPITMPETLPAETLAGARGKTLVQISDVHVGSRSCRFLDRVVAKVNTLDADYVVITGDLIDFRHINAGELRSLTSLRAPAYYCIGNHERYVDLEDICARLEGLGIRVLRNASTEVDALQLIGIDDAEARSQVARELPKLQPATDKFRILLYHRPDGAEAAEQWGAHLMLCGHTHNGQIIPFNLLVRRIFPRVVGRFEIGNLTLYVSPGTGTWGPVLRLGSRCEISIMQLQ